jgi:hypothetical protein
MSMQDFKLGAQMATQTVTLNSRYIVLLLFVCVGFARGQSTVPKEGHVA